MTKKLLLFWLLSISALASAQIFNRSIFLKGSQGTPTVMRSDSATYVTAYFGQDIYRSTAILKLDEQGATQASDSVGITSFPNSWYGASFPTGIHKLNDGTFYLYGELRQCDVAMDFGAFIIHYDQDLNRLDEAIFLDSSAASYSFVPMDSGRFVFVSYGTMIGLDSLFNKTFYKKFPYGINSAVHLAGNELLLVSENQSGQITTSFAYNVVNGDSTFLSYMDRSVYELTDSTFATLGPSQKFYIHDKASLLKTDSITLPAITGFQFNYLDLRSEAIIVLDSHHYAILHKGDLSLIDYGSLHSNESINYASGFYYNDSLLSAAIPMRGGQIHLENVKAGKPKAPVFDDLELKLKHMESRVTKYDSTIGLVHSSSDWKVTVVNKSNITLNKLGVSYRHHWGWNCGGDRYALLRDNLNVTPGDSVEIELKGLNYANITTTADFNVWFSAAVVMANDNIVKSHEELGIQHIIKNVGLPESTVEDIRLKIFPNPAANKLYVVGGEFTGRLEIYNTSGQKFLEKMIELQPGQKTAVNIETLPKGIYLLKVLSAKSHTETRFVKE